MADAELFMVPGKVPRARRGQTAVEYLLVTVSLLFVFVLMHKALQYALANQFKRGSLVIIKMYKEDPW
ncbi:MAG: hypothetical protein HY952_01115 [Elusimicrobia bacterium]|nr:hypothetical protein [Elusimicrobiota bacterium]